MAAGPGRNDVVTPSDDIGRDVVTELACLVVRRAAPDELRLLPTVADSFFERDTARNAGRDEALLSPYILALAASAAAFLGTLAPSTDKIKDAAVRRMLRTPSCPEPITLTPGQAEWLHHHSYRNALTLGLPRDEAQLVADAFLASVNRST